MAECTDKHLQLTQIYISIVACASCIKIHLGHSTKSVPFASLINNQTYI